MVMPKFRIGQSIEVRHHASDIWMQYEVFTIRNNTLRVKPLNLRDEKPENYLWQSHLEFFAELKWSDKENRFVGIRQKQNDVDDHEYAVVLTPLGGEISDEDIEKGQEEVSVEEGDYKVSKVGDRIRSAKSGKYSGIIRHITDSHVYIEIEGSDLGNIWPETGLDQKLWKNTTAMFLKQWELEPKSEEVSVVGEKPSGEMAALAAMLKPYFQAKINIDEVAAKVLEEVQKNTPRVVEVKMNGAKAGVKLEATHKQFDTLLNIVAARKHVYMFGAPGSGKSTAAHQVALSLGFKYGYISLNPQTPDSRILGYKDANGVYQSTVFRDIYQNGGVFCIDELDNAAASLLVTLNSALENGSMAFPDGMVSKHDSFVLVAGGNTSGRGASPAFPDRRPFDGAFMERFIFVKWEYDEGLERRLAMGRNPDAKPWVDYCQALRKWAATNLPRLIVSPRDSINGADLLKAGFKPLEVAEMAIFKGMDQDAKDKALKGVKICA